MTRVLDSSAARTIGAGLAAMVVVARLLVAEGVSEFGGWRAYTSSRS